MNLFLPMKENRDFRRLYAKGKSCVNPALVSYVMKNRVGVTRVGITTSKKTGNAVKRNRSRRLIREAVRSLSEKLSPGYDIVFVARAKTPFLKCADVTRAMAQQLKSTGVLK